MLMRFPYLIGALSIEKENKNSYNVKIMRKMLKTWETKSLKFKQLNSEHVITGLITK